MVGSVFGHDGVLETVAVAPDCSTEAIDGFTVVDLLRDHLEQLKVPVLGGLPLGHGQQPQSTLVGSMALLDAAAGALTVYR